MEDIGKIEKMVFEMDTDELIIFDGKSMNNPIIQKLIDIELINRGEK